MEKMRMESLDMTAQNIEKIGALFPNCITETKDENGKLKKAVNFDLLKQMLSDEIADKDEAYEFTWVGKNAAIVEANKPIRKTLRPCKEESVNWDTTENLYIEGDNLEVLKLLQESYLGKVKMIYIDPPYNTGSDFIYRDDFKVSAGEYEEDLGMYDEEGNRMFKNTDSNGRFHSDWCSMIYSRLLLARNLLKEDGYICISIDDNEVENVKKIASEIFGDTNFVAQFIIIRSEGGGLAKRAVIGHDYMIVFTKNIERCHSLGRPKDIRGKIVKKDGEDYWIETDWFREVFGKYGTCHYEDILNFYSQLKKDEIDAGIKNGNYILIPRDGKHIVGRYRKVADDTSKFYTILKHLNKNGVADLQNLELNKFFDYPKPVSLIKEFVQGVTISSKKENDIILDFFSGSATAAHAVMQLNAEDSGNRKFIMVQLPELTDEKSEAYKAGYKNICEIGKERIRRAGKKIVESFQLSVDSCEEKKNGKLQRASGLAKVNGNGEGDLFSSEETSEGGNLRIVRPDETGSGIGALEHCGRAGTEFKERVCSVFEDSKRLQVGTGNPATNLCSSGLSDGTGYSESNESSFGNRKNDNISNKNSDNSQLKTDNYKLDIGFRVLKVADSNMKDVYYSASEYDQSKLDMFESNIKEDRNDLDLLFGCLLDWGLPLSLPYTSEKLGDFTVHTYNEGDLVACFNEDVSEDVVKAIARKKPLRAVFRDSSFSNSASKINVFEIFKMISPETSVKVI